MIDRLLSTPLDRLCVQVKDSETYFALDIGVCCKCGKHTNVLRHVSTITEDVIRPAPYSDTLYNEGDRIFNYMCEHH